MRSMTGFGRAKIERNNRIYTIEIKSVNPKHKNRKHPSNFNKKHHPFIHLSNVLSCNNTAKRRHNSS